MKRFLMLFICLCLCAGLFPITAAARESLNAAILDSYFPEGGATSQTVGQKPDKIVVNARVTPYEDPNRPNLQGLGSVTVGDFVINDIQLLKGENGMFLNMPFKMLEDPDTGEVEFAKVATLTPKYMGQARGNMVMDYKHQLEKKTEPPRITDQLAAARQQAEQDSRLQQQQEQMQQKNEART